MPLNDIFVRDALWNMSVNENGDTEKSAEYAKGVLVGLMSGLMAYGLKYEQAIKLCSECAPRTIKPKSVPEGWVKDFNIIHAGESQWRRSKGRAV